MSTDEYEVKKFASDIVFVVGTRPDIIKMGPIIRRIGPCHVVHTGQHYSPELDGEMAKDAGIEISHRVEVDNTVSSAGLTRQVYLGVLKYLGSLGFKGLVVVYGDTLSAMAAAMAAKTAGWKLAHVEAGLRSFDLTMPEEVARITIDALSDRLYAPTDLQKKFLLDEKLPEDKVWVSGNIVVNALGDALKRIQGSEMPTELLGKVMKFPFAIGTFHRPENVDYPSQMEKILQVVQLLALSKSVTVYLPCHPRARATLETLLKSSTMPAATSIVLLSPVMHSSMTWLLSNAEFVLTDSGGMQEESALLGKRCLTFRKSTERQETLSYGYNVLVSPYLMNFADMVAISLRHLSGPPMTPFEIYGKDPAPWIVGDLLSWKIWENGHAN